LAAPGFSRSNRWQGTAIYNTEGREAVKPVLKTLPHRTVQNRRKLACQAGFGGRMMCTLFQVLWPLRRSARRGCMGSHSKSPPGPSFTQFGT